MHHIQRKEPNSRVLEWNTLSCSPPLVPTAQYVCDAIRPQILESRIFLTLFWLGWQDKTSGHLMRLHSIWKTVMYFVTALKNSRVTLWFDLNGVKVLCCFVFIFLFFFVCVCVCVPACVCLFMWSYTVHAGTRPKQFQPIRAQKRKLSNFISWSA